MVPLEGHGEGQPDGQVGEDAEEAVGQRPLHAEAGVVRDLVNGWKIKKIIIERHRFMTDIVFKLL